MRLLLQVTENTTTLSEETRTGGLRGIFISSNGSVNMTNAMYDMLRRYFDMNVGVYTDYTRITVQVELPATGLGPDSTWSTAVAMDNFKAEQSNIERLLVKYSVSPKVAIKTKITWDK